jgi:hypothetical protein
MRWPRIQRHLFGLLEINRGVHEFSVQDQKLMHRFLIAEDQNEQVETKLS